MKICEKMAQFDAKKFAESQPKKDTPRKDKGSREEKQKPQAERKEEKKAAAPAPEEEMDECEQALAAEPKAKDPFAHLPKSTFVLDEFKRSAGFLTLRFFFLHICSDCLNSFFRVGKTWKSFCPQSVYMLYATFSIQL